MVSRFCPDAYLEIDTISNKVAQMQRAGYIPVATFVLSDNCWTEHFYTPRILAQKAFLKKYAENVTVADLITSGMKWPYIINIRRIPAMFSISGKRFRRLQDGVFKEESASSFAGYFR